GHALARAPQRGEAAGERRDARVLAPALDRHRELAPPVRMLVDRARQVRLLAELEHVLRLHHEELAWREGEEEMRARRRGLQPFARARLGEARLVRLALRALLLRFPAEAERLAQGDVVRLEVALPRRKVVRAHAGERIAGIVLRRQVAALSVLLEEE